jgi:xanthine dehydrogenase accessory factor
MSTSRPLVIVRGGGDLATGVAARLFRCGFAVVVLEIDRPLAVRRLVALAEAIYAHEVEIEDIKGLRVESSDEIAEALAAGFIPVMPDPMAESRVALAPVALVDARMRKVAPEIGMEAAPFVVGLGPGFEAGVNCHAVVETQRGHHMGRVIWKGSASADSRMPEPVTGFDVDRVLRAPAEGMVHTLAALGDIVRRGQVLARIERTDVAAPFDGALRGLIHDGLPVWRGDKIGDLDPRKEPAYCRQISDKSLAVGGGVLEALLSQTEIRRRLGD